MKSYRKSLPPLDSLLFFHAAVRNRSLAAAAEELFVTQAAVSKRIQRFEDWLGTPLFSREGRNLQITEAGQGLATDVEIALDFLERAVEKVKAPEQPVVRIAANGAVSMFWLYARLKAFALSDLSCNVNVSTTDVRAELLSELHDLAIVYCDGNVPGWETIGILGGELVPAAAPRVAERAEQLGMFETQVPAREVPPLLEYTNITPEWINWQVWLRRLGLPPVAHWPTVACSSYVQSVGKALAGEGVVLANLSLLENEIDNGDLVRIGTVGLTPRKSYYLCHKKGDGLSSPAQDLLAFLAGENWAQK